MGRRDATGAFHLQLAAAAEELPANLALPCHFFSNSLADRQLHDDKPPTMSAIGSLVFCLDCGNLLDTSAGKEKDQGSEKAILTCEVCGARCRGMRFASR
jgi:hypothetical protein